MATNYPSQKDVWQDKAASQPIVAADFNNLQDAIAVLQAKVGADNSATVTTVDYRVNNFINATNYMYFYENTAPTGWTATLTTGDYILCTASGDFTFAGPGGVVATHGNWTLEYYDGATYHDDWVAYSHNHKYIHWSGNLNYGRISLGYQVQYGAYRSGGGVICCYCTGDAEPRNSNASIYSSNTTHTHTFDGTWRPAAAVGVLANYTGA